MTNYNQQLDLLYQYLCGWIDNKWWNLERGLTFKDWKEHRLHKDTINHIRNYYSAKEFRDIILCDFPANKN